MSPLLEFLLNVLSQFAGGTGVMENNLVRFSIPAITYTVLFSVAWSRQREYHLPREKLLVWGFGLGSASAIVMALFVALQMLGILQREAAYPILVPVERALEISSIIVVSGAFILYILNESVLSYRYIQLGLAVTFLCLLVALWQWPYYYSRLTEASFHTSWVSYLFEVVSSAFLITSIIMLRRRRGWLASVVTVALVFFLMGELILLANYATGKKYASTICPIGNTFPILAIPLLAYVYLREQAMDTRRAQKDLELYRDNLEALVLERTAEIATVNAQLKDEIRERKQAEAEIAQRNANLAAQNTIGSTLNRTLVLETILDNALDSVLSIVRMEAGLVYLWDSSQNELILRSYRGPIFKDGTFQARPEWQCCESISADVMKSLEAVVISVAECSGEDAVSLQAREGFEILVSIPLTSNALAVGALTLASRQNTLIQKHELELLTIIGQQIGMAVENAHLYQKAEQAAKELTLLHEISVGLTSTFQASKIYEQIVEQSVKLLNCQSAWILAWNEEEQRVRLVAGYGLNGAETEVLQSEPDEPGCLQELVQCKESVLIGYAGEDHRIPQGWRAKLKFQALFCTPIQGVQEPLGVLFLMDRRSARRWRYEERVLIESFVNRAAVALINANLIKQLEWAAALEERQRIAADMHDGLAQTVSLLGLQIEGAMEMVEAGSTQKAIEDLAQTRETVGQVSVEVRRSIASLKGTPHPRRSLQELLASIPEQLSYENALPVRLDFRVQEPVFLRQEQGEQAVLVTQEALLNANRHARARSLTLRLERLDQEVRITVEDDGAGFAPGEWWKNSQEHFGLSIMHSRAARIGARLQIDSSPGQGTRVILAIPAERSKIKPKVETSSLGAARKPMAEQARNQ